MKRYIIFLILTMNVLAGVRAQDTQATAVNVSGTENAYFNYADERNTENFTNTYGRSTNDVWHKLVLTRAMEIVISHCGSTLPDTYMHLLDSSGTVMEYNDDCDGLVCEKRLHSYIKRILMPGTYYIVSEGYSSNGAILLTVRGNSSPNYLPHTDIGVQSADFYYSNVQNTGSSQNYYTERSPKDVTYKLTITRAMDITISHCLSTIPVTYLHLLDASGNRIAYSDGNTGTSPCSVNRHAYLKKSLPAGIYYIVSEGYDNINAGPILTRVEGKVTQVQTSASQSQTYIRTRTYTSDNGSSYLDVVQYYDAFGHPIEQVQVGITPELKDLVSYQEYDGFGRESKSWLPALANGNNGAFIALDSYGTKSTATYNNTAYNILSDAEPYAYPVYESSSLNRVVEQYGTGKSWHQNGKSVKTAYMTNSSSFVVPYFTVPDSRYAVSVTRSGNYASGELYVTEFTDEEGNKSYEARDKLGQLIYTRQMDGTTAVQTSYVYDSFGNLRAVLPPLAVKDFTSGTWTETTQKFKDYVYFYWYSARGICISKKIPGAEKIFYYHDRTGQLIAMQDGEMLHNRRSMFFVPDAFGRIVLTGMYKDNHPVQASGIVKATYVGGNNKLGGYAVAGITFMDSLVELHTINYYDNYDFKSLAPFGAAYDHAVPSGFTDQRYGSDSETKHKGLLTGTVTYVLNDTTRLGTCFYYDNQGRVVQTISGNYLKGLEKEYVNYSFTGLPVKKQTVHSASGKTTQTETYTYDYDHAGRLVQTRHKLNSEPEITLSAHVYDELGRLKSTMNDNNPKMLNRYSYNIRSWLSKIDCYAMNENLDYYYNGNIKSMEWKQLGLRKYTFTYDGLSRLKIADYTGPSPENYRAEYTYDQHGNIMTLKRYGMTGTNSYGLVDNMSYIYNNSNQLYSIHDAAGNIALSNSSDFKKYRGLSMKEYSFNAIGSLTQDLNKGISAITYNNIGLPLQIDIKSPVAEARNSYTYSADGQKHRVVQKWNPSYSTTPVIGSDVNTSLLTASKTTDYAGNKIYENGTLKKILTEAGYYDYPQKKHYFYIQNHLGSNVGVADRDGFVGQNTFYYPDGLSFAISNDQARQPYKFNGKELDMMHGLNQYDYEARYYDPGYARFTTMDPLMEKNYSVSQYVYCKNNFVNRIDPTGLTDYKVNTNGYISDNSSLWDKIKKLWNGPDKTDKLIASNGNTLEMKAGTMTNFTDKKNGKGVTVGQTFTVTDSDKAAEIHGFLSENVKNIEFGEVDAIQKGETSSIITNSFKSDVNDASSITQDLLKKGADIPLITHNHPQGTPPSQNDKNAVSHFNTYFPNSFIEHRIYNATTKTYIYYNDKGITKIVPKK